MEEKHRASRWDFLGCVSIRGWWSGNGGALLDVRVNLYGCCSCGTEFDLSVLSSALPLREALPSHPSIPPSFADSLWTGVRILQACKCRGPVSEEGKKNRSSNQDVVCLSTEKHLSITGNLNPPASFFLSSCVEAPHAVASNELGRVDVINTSKIPSRADTW